MPFSSSWRVLAAPSLRWRPEVLMLTLKYQLGLFLRDVEGINAGQNHCSLRSSRLLLLWIALLLCKWRQQRISCFSLPLLLRHPWVGIEFCHHLLVFAFRRSVSGLWVSATSGINSEWVQWTRSHLSNYWMLTMMLAVTLLIPPTISAYFQIQTKRNFV